MNGGRWGLQQQGDTAEEDEEEDGVGEGRVVDDPVANLPDPFDKQHQ